MPDRTSTCHAGSGPLRAVDRAGTSAVLQVQTSVERPEDARALVDALVAERLAACGQVLGPVESVYWWSGDIQATREWLVVLKTTIAAYPALEARLGALHPYEQPEIIAVPVVAGSPGYLAWVAAETTAGSAGS